jgi:Cof subfamily protein (haloacid dehalogenase superfamily)
MDINQVKLIVFDIDGTLLDENHNLLAQTRKVLDQLKERGTPFTLATGKNWDSVQPLADELEIDAPIILANGTIVRKRNGEVLLKITLPVSATHKIIQICEEHGFDLSIYLDEEVFVKKINHNIALLNDYGSSSLIEVGDWRNIEDRLPNSIKCHVIERKTRQKLFDLEKIVRAELGDEISCIHTLREMFEMLPKDASKANALAKVCDYMGLVRESVVTFGDGNNDIGMLTMSGIGITPANASMSPKANADLIVPSNDRGGPAEYLDYLLSSSKSCCE